MVSPDVTVVTSIGSEHHPTLPRLETTREEKAHMVRALAASGLAVLNGDDPHVMWMATVAPGRVVTFGVGTQCDVRASDVRLDWPRGMRFRLHADGQTRDVAIRLIGRQMVYPFLAAIAVALAERVPLDDAIARCGAMAPLPCATLCTSAPPPVRVPLPSRSKVTVYRFIAKLAVQDRSPVMLASWRVAVRSPSLQLTKW